MTQGPARTEAPTPSEFGPHLAALDRTALLDQVHRATPDRVTAALARQHPTLEDLAVLLSDAAGDRLEELAQRARDLTIRRFGRAVRLFAPLYVSNHCLSSCTYCGFARAVAVDRSTLSLDQVDREASILLDRGFRHLLLVSGEHRVEVSPDYLYDCLLRLRARVPSLSIETQTWSEAVYQRLVAAGMEGVVHYQETYDRDRYHQVHPAGWKRDFDRRLAAVESAGRAGTRRLGLGVLLGLSEDWRSDVLALAAHAAFLVRRYWRSEVTVSLPRINPSASGFQPVAEVDDRRYVQALAALRIFEPDAGIVLSTRERPDLRDGLVGIAVTHMSAGASTRPGGYRESSDSHEQFAVADARTVTEVARMIADSGREAVFQDAFPIYRVADATVR